MTPIVTGKQKIVVIVSLLLSLVVLSLAAQAQETERDAMTHFFHSSFNNLAEELRQAKSEGKQGVFVMFSDPDCPWCQKMKSSILNQAGIQDYFQKHFRVLHLDTRGDTMMTDFDGVEISEKDFAFKKHRVRATPVFIIFDLNGKDVLRYTGTARDSREFKLLGEFVVSGAYLNTNFTTFKRQRLADNAAK